MRTSRLIGRPMVGRRVVLAAHGSADPRHAATIAAIADAVRDRLRRNLRSSRTNVVVGYLDHCTPRLADIVVPGDVVVPLLLSAGYHAAVDIPQVVGPSCIVTPPLGPDPRLVRAAADRLRATGWDNAQPGYLVLAAAGSSDPQAARDIDTVAGWLADEVGREVVPAYLSAARPRAQQVAPEVAAVVTYLLAPGRFADLAAAAGAPVTTDVLGDHPAVADIVVDRIAAAVAGRTGRRPVRPAARLSA